MEWNDANSDGKWADTQFRLNDRLGIEVPALTVDWDGLSREKQMSLLSRWENIRGTIPDHVRRFEDRIRKLQTDLFEEDDFATSCRLNSDIADLASRINDLHIWFRTQQDLDDDTKRHS